MQGVKIGLQLIPQHTSFAEYRRAWLRADELGVDSLWTWDHFFPLSPPEGPTWLPALPRRALQSVRRRFGWWDPDGPRLEGWTVLAALAGETRHAQIGPLVLSIGYRNPALLAAMATTLDHATGGRLILGLGAGWFERDYTEYGFEFGGVPARLRALERGIETIKQRWERDNPKPLRGRIPILIGGGGEKVTLRLAALHADLWHGFGPLDVWRRKSQVLNEWCARLGRNPREIERAVSFGQHQLDLAPKYAAAGAGHIIYLMGAPFDLRPVEDLLAWRERWRSSCTSALSPDCSKKARRR